tara:strand:- start:2470 stop:2709 length:240 start_codon:yes stop_codon:yes gene_type:complete
MKAIIYSDRNLECERAEALLEACSFDEVITYYVNKDFTNNQFKDEFGCEANYPQISIGINHIGGLKDTLHYLSDKGMFV